MAENKERIATLVSDDEPQIDTFRARIIVPTRQSASRGFGEPSDSQIELIRAQMVDPSVIEDAGVFAFQVEASNNLLDSYFTRMHETSLKNYAEDAKAGLSWMNSHRTGGMLTDAEQPYGRSFDGTFVGAGGRGNAKMRVDEWFYIPRGATPNGPGAMSADDMIHAIRTGTGRDVSISFWGGSWRCSICDRDMMVDWSCMHLPGFAYKPVDKDGKVVQDTDERVTAVAWIWDAHQTEASSVYDGATPQAMVKKAGRMAAEGILKPHAIDLVEQRYRIHLPHRTTHAVALPESTGASSNSEEERTMPEGTSTGTNAGVEQSTNANANEAQRATPPAAVTVDGLAGIRTALSGRGITPESSVADIELVVRTVLDEHRTRTERLEQLDSPETQRLIADGRQFGELLRQEAIEEGVRAFGTEFETETYTELFKTASLDHVKRLRDKWRSQADAAIPSGRTTGERPESTEGRQNGVAGRETPAKAYSTRS